MWKRGITLTYASNSSIVKVSLCCVVAILDYEPPIVQDSHQKNCNMIFFTSWRNKLQEKTCQQALRKKSHITC